MNGLHYLIETSVQMANAFYYSHRILLLFPFQLLQFRGTRRDWVFSRAGPFWWHKGVNKPTKETLSLLRDTTAGGYTTPTSGCHGSMPIKKLREAFCALAPLYQPYFIHHGNAGSHLWLPLGGSPLWNLEASISLFLLTLPIWKYHMQKKSPSSYVVESPLSYRVCGYL